MKRRMTVNFSSSFIRGCDKLNELEKFVAAPYFRKNITFDELLEKCEITLTGQGFYRIWINGTEITKGLLAPYISNPDDYVYYDNYELSKYIRKGVNAFCFQLGNGMRNAPGGFIWDFQKASFRGLPCLAFCVEYELNGEKYSVEADESVKWMPSPLYFDDLRCGARYDARNEIKGWNEPDFDDSAWNNAALCDAPKGEKKLCEANPVKPTGEEIAPVSVRPGESDYYIPHELAKKITPQELPGETKGFIYDFGVNKAGIVRLKINGRPGQRIEMQFAEHISESGKLFYANIDFYPDGYSQRDVYICSGDGEEIFEPSFTYHGFRYCLVTGIDESQATEELLTYIVANSELEERGGFSCSDETANTLQKMCRISDLANFYYFPTDCPHREKNGWTGDIASSCEHMLQNLKAETSFKEWLNNVRKAQRANGSVPAVVPCGSWGGECGPAWDCVLTFLPYYIYSYTGDRSVLEENAAAIYKYLQYITGKKDERGLTEVGLGDWCAVKGNCKPRVSYTSSVMTVSIAEKAAFIFDLLGMTQEKEYALKLYSEVRNAVRKQCIDFDALHIDNDCQTGFAMAIYYGILNDDEKPLFFEKLVKMIHENDDFIDFGLLGSRTLFHVLSEFGESELAYKMICRREWPSYGWFIDAGFTSLPEDFQMPGKRIDSLNHHFMGDISNWFISRVAGLRYNPGVTDTKDLVIQPAFISSLTHAEAYYESPCGRIDVSWRRDGGTVKVEAKFPEEINASLVLPDGISPAEITRTPTSLTAKIN